jgi:nicotianamine synthase
MFSRFFFLIQANAIVWLLEQQSSLRPNPLVNFLLRHLVRIILHTNATIAESVLDTHAHLAERARTIAGIAEGFLEQDWAFCILSHKKPNLALSQFPYLSCYQSLAETEIQQIRERSPNANTILFLGGGSLPLSAILLAQAGYNVTVLDHDSVAVSLSAQIVKRLRLGKMIDVHLSSAEQFDRYSEFDVIIIGALVGETVEEKNKLISQIMSTAKKGCPILCRSVDGLCTFLYLSVPCLHTDATHVPAQKGKHINSLVIYQTV